MAMGMVTVDGITANWGRAVAFEVPLPFKYGFDFSLAALIGFCLMAFVSAVETVGDVSGITKGGAGREATDKEIAGATYADGFGTAIAGAFGALPNTSFSQNVGLIAMTGVMSRHVVTIGALFLILCGLAPKVGAVIGTIPIEVLGGGVIVMFGMVVAAGISMLSDVNWNRRNMVIFAIALSVGLGLQLDPKSVQYLPDTLQILMTSGLLPAALIAIVLNLVLPEELAAEATEEVSGGLAGHGRGSLPQE
jgi:xanthine/uracil permease